MRLLGGVSRLSGLCGWRGDWPLGGVADGSGGSAVRCVAGMGPACDAALCWRGDGRRASEGNGVGGPLLFRGRQPVGDVAEGELVALGP